MQIIKWPNGAGKTSELLAYMLLPENSDVHYIAPTMRQAASAGEMFEKHGGDATGRFHSAMYLHTNNSGLRGHHRFVIDEAEGVLGGLVGGTIEAVTFTDRKVKDDPAWTSGIRGYSRLYRTSQVLNEGNN